MIVSCMECGIEFNRKESEIQKSDKYFCNAKCWGKSKDTRISYTCMFCGKEFLARPATPTNPHRFCTRKCYTDWNKGSNHPKYKDGKCHAKNGYVYISTAKNNGQSEHRLIYEKFLGRELTNDEFVHHRNGIRHDNRIENLELWNTAHPPGRRVDDTIEWAKKFLEQYGYIVFEQQGAKPPQ